MSEDTKIQPVPLAPQPGEQKPAEPKSDEVGQQEFLQLLVHQLQNQDPLNPLSSEEFAVQLAQFSQLEQLVEINEKIGGSEPETSSLSVNSMASFLGNEVVLPDGEAEMAAGKGPNVLVDFPEGIQSGRIDYIDANGVVAGSKQLDAPTAGRQVISLDQSEIQNGTYSIRVVAVNGSGQFQDIDAKVTGTVEGFIVEPEPALIVNGQQVSINDVEEVQAGN